MSELLYTNSSASLNFIHTNAQYIKHIFSYYKHAYVRFVLCSNSLWKTCFLGSVSHKFASHYWTCHINPENVLIRLLATRLVHLVVHIRILMNPPNIMWTYLSFVYNSYTYSNIFPFCFLECIWQLCSFWIKFSSSKASCSCGTSSQVQIWIIALLLFSVIFILFCFKGTVSSPKNENLLQYYG